MASLTQSEAVYNRLPTSRPCPDCQGSGVRMSFRGRPEVGGCPACAGSGRFQAKDYYLATSADDVVDVGEDLIPFLEGLRDAFCHLAGEDVALWHVTPGGPGPRLVACLSPGPDGKTSLRWLY